MFEKSIILCVSYKILNGKINLKNEFAIYILHTQCFVTILMKYKYKL